MQAERMLGLVSAIKEEAAAAIPNLRRVDVDTWATWVFGKCSRSLCVFLRSLKDAAAQLWHCGCYDPAQPRATLHDIVDTPECT